MQMLAAHPNLASKRWIYNQYDSMVGTINMGTNNQSDASIVNIKGSKKALAMKVDCNSRYVNADPEIGCAIAVCESARNIACSGGVASAVTNCLNFGNPYNPEVYWQFVGAIKGMGAACSKLQTPVTGGNVSFYNQSSYEGPVFPTPTIGMIGLVEDKKYQTTLAFKNEGDLIYLVGKQVNDIACSEYVYTYHKIKNTPAPYFNLDEEYALHKAINSVITKGLIKSAHDISDGGLFINLLESGAANNLGVEISSNKNIRKDAFLFGEAQGRAVVSISKEKQSALEAELKAAGVPFENIGIVKGKNLVIDGNNYGSVTEYNNLYNTSIETKLN
jgi:phosphoribosylformylglycinamidine synthase subunit PurL